MGGTQVVGTVTLNYANGQTQTFTTTNTLWDQLRSGSILTANGQQLNGITVNMNIAYSVKGISSSVTAQYWVVFYMQVTGPAGVAYRAINLPLLGNVESYVGDIQGTPTYDTNRWYLLRNNLGFGPYANYYAEKGSGLQVGNINLGPGEAYDVTQALTGVPVAGPLASQLTTLLGTTTKSDGQTEPLITWTRTGPQFYQDMWSIAYPASLWGVSLPSGTYCVPFTTTCGGAGAYLRMHQNDQYTVSFKAGIFYRWQDATGFWTGWQEKNQNLATFTLGVANGWYTVLGINVGGGINLF